MHWYGGVREQNDALVSGVVALEHCGGHFSGGARALRRQIWTQKVKWRQDQRDLIVGKIKECRCENRC